MKSIVSGIFLLLLAAAFACADEPKTLSLSAFSDFEGKQVTVAVLKEIIPYAGGNGVIRNGEASVKLINSKDRVSPWTGSGSFTVWVILGDPAANKKAKDKTAGLSAEVFESVDFSGPAPLLKWGRGKPLSKFDLVEFVENY
jgi:hypothetical protein